MSNGFEDVARGGATAFTDLMKQMAPSMVQNTLQNDFRMKHLTTQLDATKEDRFASTELEIINNIWNTGDWGLIDSTLSKGTWASDRAGQAVIKLLPIARAKAQTQKEFRGHMEKGESKWIRDNIHRVSGDQFLLTEVKTYLDGNVHDKAVLVETYLKMFPDHPQGDSIRQLASTNPENALNLFLFTLEQSQKGLEVLGKIIDDPEALRMAGFPVDMLFRRYQELTKSAIPSKYGASFQNLIGGFNTQGLNLSADVVYNKAEDILREQAQAMNLDEKETSKFVTRENIEQFSIDQLSNPESDAFKTFMTELGVRFAPKKEEEPGIFEKGRKVIGDIGDIFAGEEIPEDIEQFSSGQWELPSGEDVAIRERGGKFRIRTTKGWQQQQQGTTQGKYPDWVDISIEELRKLALQKR